jgi:hypothetical protein
MPVQVQIKPAARLSLLPPYLFAELDRLKREVQQKGVDVISLGIGDPDLPTPAHIVEALKRTAEIPANHRYPDYQGLDRFREAAAGWYKRRFNVILDPASEVCALIGSKEGIANFPVAVVDPGVGGVRRAQLNTAAAAHATHGHQASGPRFPWVAEVVGCHVARVRLLGCRGLRNYRPISANGRALLETSKPKAARCLGHPSLGGADGAD